MTDKTATTEEAKLLLEQEKTARIQKTQDEIEKSLRENRCQLEPQVFLKSGQVNTSIVVVALD